MITIQIANVDSSRTAARGRNGWFVLTHIDVWKHSIDGTVWVSFRGKKTRSDPCMVTMNPEDTLALAEALQQAEGII